MVPWLALLLPQLLLGDHYTLLGVRKAADNREIRKAFKKLALKLHPDKNDAADAHEQFLKITRAYEVLKDEEKRKKYDMFGEEEGGGGSRGRGQYESWSYYHSDFGLYDEDEEIVTLDYREFQDQVLKGYTVWFVNFYSPRCGHCHDLAPAWRELARELEGTGVMVAAVNCQEEPHLCRSQGITGYPSLLLYTLGEGTKKYSGVRTFPPLLAFLTKYVQDHVVTLWSGNLASWSGGSEPWLVVLCGEGDCLPTTSRRLVGASLEGLASVGVVECGQDPQLCTSLGRQEDGAGDVLVYLPRGLQDQEGRVVLEAGVEDHRGVAAEVLAAIPALTKLDTEAFQEMRRRLDKEVAPGWLVVFTQGGDSSPQYKKLPSLLPRLRVGAVDCRTSHSTCDELYILRFPSFALFKVGGAMELHYGKPGLREVAAFARLASQAHTMETLVASDFPDILHQSRGGVFVDFFAPWCPPCMALLPEFRKASTLIGGSVTFGTLDCTVHGRLCRHHGVSAYPTTVFFNGTRPHKYSGVHRGPELAEFVEDLLRPVVIELTASTFHQRLGAKPEGEVWLVDYFAPWCGPCQQLAPEWRGLAKLLQANPRVHVAKVDCTVEQGLCHQQGVSGYPTIRMYPRGSQGSARYQPYPGQARDTPSLHRWLQEQLPSKVEQVTPFIFRHSILSSPSLWLVEFYTPWCSHCTSFAPHYEQVGEALEGRARVARVDCERWKQLCSQAGAAAFPTLRIYQGTADIQEYEEVVEREVEAIVHIVELRLAKEEEEKREEEEREEEEREEEGKRREEHDEL